MSRRVTLISLSVALPLLFVALFFHASHLASQGEAWREKIDPALAQAAPSPGQPLSFIIHLSEQADLTSQLPADKPERRAAIAHRLQQAAASGQQGLLASLAPLQAAGQVHLVRPLWIVNAIAVEAAIGVVEMLAQRADVAAISLDVRQQFVLPQELQPEQTPDAGWNLRQVRAPEVWHGLGVDGDGVTIAIMDTGVDWRHPDLRNSYRGWRDNNPVRHEGNWYDAILTSSDGEPFDPNGHGTHVAGTAVGRNTGVAPGAKWIAVRAFDSRGFATTSDLLLAFQWLLAPDGQPELAPDVINGSWSGPANNAVFESVLHIFREANIVTVFAAGNAGPAVATIGAPAAHAQAIAVAAVDYRPEVTWFSSRGPSPLTARPKPDVAAPGGGIYSTQPDGAYANYNGTSMATPHVAGLAALLLSANPALDAAALHRTITETAKPVSAQGHDIHQGWGQIDAYAAVAGQMSLGRVQGAVLVNGAPEAGVEITISNPSGGSFKLLTANNGQYEAWLRPGAYTVNAAKYGHQNAPAASIHITAGSIAHHNLNLQRRPQAPVSGRVTGNDGVPLADVKIRVDGAPISTTTGEDGRYSMALPTGAAYAFVAERNGFRIARTTLALPTPSAVSQDFTLAPAQTILLVDSGRWYYDSQSHYFQDALHRAGFAFDQWNVYAPSGTPSAEELAAYDTVIWTAPQDAPGWSGGADALAAYLDGGGNLLVSGQNVAQRDGQPPTAHSWFSNQLQASYVGPASPPFVVTGEGSRLFSGLSFQLNGPDGATNQETPAQVAPLPGSLTQPVLRYAGGGEDNAAALQAGLCQPYRILFAAFGLEAAPSAQLRADILEQSLQYFAAPPQEKALALTPSQTNEVLLPGEMLTVTFALHNLSEVHTTTIDLDYRSEWPAHLSHSSVRLGPCAKQTMTLTLQAPSPLPPGARQAIELNARADYGAVAGASIVATAPQPMLLVADYRWYDQTGAYRGALQNLNLEADIWDTNERGSPSLQRLAAYDAVLWFTGYDWYQPLTPQEITTLRGYLDGGGRLFLSSQDYLYYHRRNPFTQNYLGILDYQEHVTSTLLLGGGDALLSAGENSFSLHFDQYRNFSDGLLPAAGADVHLWNGWGSGAGVLNRGDPWRSIFWGVPFELLAPPDRPVILSDIVARLGDLGDSSLQLSPRVAPASDPRYYTLTVQNWQHGVRHTAWATTTLDASLTIIPSSLGGDSVYVAGAHQVQWNGDLMPGESHQISFMGYPGAGSGVGGRHTVTSTIAYEGQQRPWQQTASTWVAAPEFGDSKITAPAATIKPYAVFTYHAVLVNSAPVAADRVSATLAIPYGLVPITPTIKLSDGAVDLSGNRLHWHGVIGAGQSVTVTVVVSSTGFHETRFLQAGLVVDDGLSTPTVRNHVVAVQPHRWLLPLIHLADP